MICTHDSYFKPLHKQEPGLVNEMSYFPHAAESGARKEKASLFSMSQASVFRANEMQLSQQSFASGVSFPKQVPRPPCSPHRPALMWPLGSPGCRRCERRLEKQGRDIKETRVLKRKTRMRCRGNVLLLSRPVPGGSSRVLISIRPRRLLFWVQCDSPRCPRLIARSGCALWWLKLLTYLLELGPDAERGRHWKQYLSRRCFKPAFLLFISITCWPQWSADRCVWLNRTRSHFSIAVY